MGEGNTSLFLFSGGCEDGARALFFILPEFVNYSWCL